MPTNSEAHSPESNVEFGAHIAFRICATMGAIPAPAANITAKNCMKREQRLFHTLFRQYQSMVRDASASTYSRMEVSEPAGSWRFQTGVRGSGWMFLFVARDLSLFSATYG